MPKSCFIKKYKGLGVFYLIIDGVHIAEFIIFYKKRVVKSRYTYQNKKFLRYSGKEGCLDVIRGLMNRRC